MTQHYRLLPLSDIADCLATGRTLPPATAAITIDDGYRDFYEVAFPLLLKYRAPATLYVATDFIDHKTWLWTDKLRFLTERTPASEVVAVLKSRTQRFALTDHLSRLRAADKINAALKTLPNDQKEETIKRIAATLDVLVPPLPPHEFGGLTWAQIREMDAEGIEVGSHTVTHPILPNVTDDEVLQYELAASKARLEEMLGRQVPLFCYPNGRNDARVQRATATAGYSCAVTNVPGMNTNLTPLLALRRICPQPDLAHFVQSTSGFEQWRRSLAGADTAPTAQTLPAAALAAVSKELAHQVRQV
ncbi:MAG: polysaccharide deacetylase family protein [Acidobacteria bacterium]|nr:polysaccharide deacetylase family protein [Acidobacteriota bacterium]